METNKVLEQLKTLRDDIKSNLSKLEGELEKTERAIVALESPVSDGKRLSTPEIEKRDKRIKRLLNKGYSTDFSFSDRVLYLLAKFGAMYTLDMGEKILELEPKIGKSVTELTKQLGYEASKLHRKGLIKATQDGFRNRYSL